MKNQISYPKSLSSRKYPKFIRTNSNTKDLKSPRKVFKDFGIKDESVKFTYKSSISLDKFLILLKDELLSYPEIIKNSRYCAHKRTLKEIEESLSPIIENFSQIKKGNKLVLPTKVSFYSLYRDRVFMYKKGGSIISFLLDMYDDIFEYLYDDKYIAAFEKLIDYAVGLELSLNKSLKIVFSTHPWDIATMSMRGIESCQAWGRRQETCLIGSIVDPNMAVIYLTDGKKHKSYGERMISRAVVRLIVPSMKRVEDGSYQLISDIKGNLRKVYLEGPYSHYSAGTYNGEIFKKIFQGYLDDRSKGNQKIIIDKNRDYIYSIPLSKEVKKLRESYRSYVDSGLGYTAKII